MFICGFVVRGIFFDDTRSIEIVKEVVADTKELDAIKRWNLVSATIAIEVYFPSYVRAVNSRERVLAEIKSYWFKAPDHLKRQLWEIERSLINANVEVDMAVIKLKRELEMK